MAKGELIKLMAKCALFADLSDKELQKLSERMDEDHFPGKTRILKEGEEGMGFFFVVLDGTAKVNQHGRAVATLKTGDFFGEITALQGGPRTASVTTVEPLWVLRLTDTNFRPVLEDYPKVTFRILEKVCTRFQALATNAGS
ncbi:MAG: family transcriptional regulator, cyclic receptor protein [Chloroflexota bacterium]|nr:family transcriptional regulator, cyclic receptor protein [Chloroflexota bacterium]